jgi:acyl-CoA thioesterase I
MKITKLLFFVIVIVAVFMIGKSLGFWGGGSAQRLVLSKGPLVCVGDSLTAAAGIDQRLAYPALLQQQLSIPAINAGLNGDNSAGLAKRLNKDVISRNPEGVIMLIGGNDLLGRLPLDQLEANLDNILSQLKGADIPVLMIQQPGGIISGKFGKVYVRVAKKHSITLVPDSLLKSFYANGATYLQPDKVHWTAEAHKELTELLVSEYITLQ